MDPQTPQTTTPTFCASTQPDGILKNTDSPVQRAVSYPPRMADASVVYSNAMNPCTSPTILGSLILSQGYLL